MVLTLIVHKGAVIIVAIMPANVQTIEFLKKCLGFTFSFILINSYLIIFN